MERTDTSFFVYYDEEFEDFYIFNPEKNDKKTIYTAMYCETVTHAFRINPDDPEQVSKEENYIGEFAPLSTLPGMRIAPMFVIVIEDKFGLCGHLCNDEEEVVEIFCDDEEKLKEVVECGYGIDDFWDNHIGVYRLHDDNTVTAVKKHHLDIMLQDFAQEIIDAEEENQQRHSDYIYAVIGK